LLKLSKNDALRRARCLASALRLKHNKFIPHCQDTLKLKAKENNPEKNLI